MDNERAARWLAFPEINGTHKLIYRVERNPAFDEANLSGEQDHRIFDENDLSMRAVKRYLGEDATLDRRTKALVVNPGVAVHPGPID